MGTLFEKAQYALESKNLLKTALNSKGASIGADLPFRTYPEKVLNLITADVITHGAFEEDTSTGGYKLTNVLFDLRVPSNKDGATVTSADISANVLARLRSIYAPLTCTNVKINNGTTDIEEIRLEGCTSLNGFTYTVNYKLLKKLVLPALATYTASSYCGEALEELVLPSCTTFKSGSGASGWSSSNPNFKIDLRSLPETRETSFSISKVWSINDRFDALKKINGTLFNGVQGASALFLPSIEEMKGTTDTLGNYTDRDVLTLATGATLDLYVGANLVNLGAKCIANLTAEGVTVHIPHGATTTKTTLDTAGVAYVQDYAV